MILSFKLTVSEALKVLMTTKNLVVVDETIMSPHPFSTITTLPKLARLDANFYADLSPDVEFLDHIRIPPQCLLIYSAQLI